jgi:RPA family protein
MLRCGRLVPRLLIVGLTVEKCAITENAVVAKKVELNNGIGDFEGENGEFNPEN